MNPSKNPSSVRSKIEITNTLLQLMNTYPYREITVKQIILESGVARKTFYRNFFSKDDVLDAYIDSVMKQYTDALLQLQDCQLPNILEVIFKFCIQNQQLFFQLRDNNLMHLFLQKWNVFIPMIHHQIVSTNHPMFQEFTDEQIDYIISFNIGAIWNVIMKWMEEDMKESSDEIKATLLKYISNLSLFT